MGTALPYALRRRIVDDYVAGKSCAALAREHAVSYQSVRILCRRFDQEGDAGILPRYARCGQGGVRSDRLLYRAACWLKRLHPGWGAAFIQIQLEDRYPDRTIPGVRTMQSWFKANRLIPRRSKRPTFVKQWASEVHQVWQIDAKEQLKSADQQALCWLTMTDEYSSGALNAPVFPPRTDLSGPVGTDSAGPDERF